MTHILNDMENIETGCWDKEIRNKLVHTYDTTYIKFRKDMSYPEWDNLGQWLPVVRGCDDEGLGPSLSDKNVLDLNCGGDYQGVHSCQNSWNYLIKYTSYYIWVIPQ